ncbi:hypothetical protein [Pseudomonas putida]|uniref:hypothetical protein n=1 Tax=Pseudomonas putida TaxID=303 RepID=UPI00300F208D
MSNNALYYPYMSIPQDAWSARTLPYWDGLATIVPMDHLYRPEQLSQFMRGLLSEGLVKHESESYQATLGKSTKTGSPWLFLQKCTPGANGGNERAPSAAISPLLRAVIIAGYLAIGYWLTRSEGQE